MLRDYYQLAKPGIVYGNLLTTLAAFLFASKWHFLTLPFLAVVLGMALVIASACVCNNYLDRDIDAKMARTKKRPLVSGAISPHAALAYAAALAIVGFTLLYICVNALTALVALAGFIIYVCVYTPLKPQSSVALYVGAVAGAAPVVAGYTAAAGKLDLTAFFLFAFLFIWQLPHFWAIAVYRYDEYAAAGVPLSVRKPSNKKKRLARSVFFASLMVLVAFCLFIALLPLLT
jgi:heme o synthase